MLNGWVFTFCISNLNEIGRKLNLQYHFSDFAIYSICAHLEFRLGSPCTSLDFPNLGTFHVDCGFNWPNSFLGEDQSLSAYKICVEF